MQIQFKIVIAIWKFALLSLINPVLSKLIYEPVKTQSMILYGSSELCVICERLHQCIN